MSKGTSEVYLATDYLFFIFSFLNREETEAKSRSLISEYANGPGHSLVADSSDA